MSGESDYAKAVADLLENSNLDPAFGRSANDGSLAASFDFTGETLFTLNQASHLSGILHVCRALAPFLPLPLLPVRCC